MQDILDGGAHGSSQPLDATDKLVPAVKVLARALGNGGKKPRKALRQPDPKEAARLTVKSHCVATQQRFSRSGNPLHVWETIWMCTNPAVTAMALPGWCITYLHETAQGLLAARDDGEKLGAFIAGQLKLT